MPPSLSSLYRAIRIPMEATHLASQERASQERVKEARANQARAVPREAREALREAREVIV